MTIRLKKIKRSLRTTLEIKSFQTTFSRSMMANANLESQDKLCIKKREFHLCSKMKVSDARLLPLETKLKGIFLRQPLAPNTDHQREFSTLQGEMQPR